MMAKESKKVWESPLLWIVALIAVAGIGTALLSSRDDGPTISNQLETSTVTLTGSNLPPVATPDPAVGTPAPAITATTLDGDRVQVGADGTPRIYGFFAHWCPHCQNEVPQVVDWLEAEDLPDGVELVAISTAVDPERPNYPPSRWFARENWPTTVLLDSESAEISNAFGLTVFPYWVAVDGNGDVVGRVNGGLDESTFRMLADLAAQ
jgi:thiol-disulfide isomerase/thioredoxin